MIVKPKSSPPYVYQPYPSYRYHATLPPRVVQSPEEDDALGADWRDHPDADNPPRADEGPKPDERALELYAASAAGIIEGINRMTDTALLNEVLSFEVANPKYAGGRKGVLKAITERVAALA